MNVKKLMAHCQFVEMGGVHANLRQQDAPTHETHTTLLSTRGEHVHQASQKVTTSAKPDASSLRAFRGRERSL
jgi:hypothetical protein